MCQGEEHTKYCMCLGRSTQVWRAAWHLRAGSDQRNQKNTPIRLNQDGRVRQEEGAECLPEWFNSPSGLAGAGSNLLRERPEAVSRNPRVTVGVQGANEPWESAWHWPTRARGVPGSSGSPRGSRWPPRSASVSGTVASSGIYFIRSWAKVARMR